MLDFGNFLLLALTHYRVSSFHCINRKSVLVYGVNGGGLLACVWSYELLRVLNPEQYNGHSHFVEERPFETIVPLIVKEFLWKGIRQDSRAFTAYYIFYSYYIPAISTWNVCSINNSNQCPCLDFRRHGLAWH